MTEAANTFTTEPWQKAMTRWPGLRATAEDQLHRAKLAARPPRPATFSAGGAGRPAARTVCEQTTITGGEAMRDAMSGRPGNGPSAAFRRARAGIVAALVTSGLMAASAFGQDERETAPPATPSALAQFTTGVEDREPIDQVTFVSNDVRKVFFFSDLRDLAGQTVTHRWIYEGETRAEVPFEVRGPRWRVWSSKELLEDWIGDWTVEIVTEDGEVIAAETFTYSPPEA